MGCLQLLLRVLHSNGSCRAMVPVLMKLLLVVVKLLLRLETADFTHLRSMQETVLNVPLILLLLLLASRNVVCCSPMPPHADKGELDASSCCLELPRQGEDRLP